MESENANEQHEFSRKCNGGAAKMLLWLGRHLEAKTLLEDQDNPAILQQCTQILEQKRLFNEAANIYEKAGMVKKAGLLYIQVNNISKASPLVADLQDHDIDIEFAKALERSKKYDAAIEIYEKTGLSMNTPPPFLRLMCLMRFCA